MHIKMQLACSVNVCNPKQTIREQRKCLCPPKKAVGCLVVKCCSDENERTVDKYRTFKLVRQTSPSKEQGKIWGLDRCHSYTLFSMSKFLAVGVVERRLKESCNCCSHLGWQAAWNKKPWGAEFLSFIQWMANSSGIDTNLTVNINFHCASQHLEK